MAADFTERLSTAREAIGDILDDVEALVDERIEVESEMAFLSPGDRRAAFARLGQIERLLKAREERLGSLYMDLSQAEAERAMFVRLGGSL